MKTLLILILLASIVGCANETADILSAGESSGEHAEGSHNEEGEESNTQYGLTDLFDETRRGARLQLRFDPDESAFIGSVENTTANILKNVRVEVHLSNGTELGPTTPKDLPSGEKMKVRLDAIGEIFDSWSAHPEVG